MKKVTVLMAAALLSGSLMISCQSQNTQPQKESTSQEQVETTAEKVATPETTQEETNNAVETAQKTASEAVETVQETAKEKTEVVKEKTVELSEKAKEKTTETVQTAKEKTSEVIESAKEKVPEVKEKVEETTTKAIETAKEKVAAAKETVAQKIPTFKPSKKIDGEQLFKQKTCSACHQPKIDMTGPSLQKIAKAYAGKREELKAFLRGKHPAVVEPNKFTIMKPQISITKKLSEEELNALIDYIYKWQ